MNVLAIATLYPNESQPVHAVFVEQRIRALAARVPVRVVCPVPWFPVLGRLPRYRHRSRIPRREDRYGIEVDYPRFLSVPRFLKPLDGLFLFLACWRAGRRIRREFPFDRIDAHLAFPDGWGAVWLGRLFRTPVSVTLRGHDVNDLPRFPVRRRQVAWTLRHADVIFAVAEALRGGAIELGAEPERVLTVGNGVNVELFFPRERAEARRLVGQPEDGRLLLSVGHLVERKGFHHLVRALPVVLRQFPDARLVIVGEPGEEGDFSREIRAAIRERELEGRVALVGAVAHEALGPWYAAADAFCLASAKEGRANVLLEALACGTPVVATRVWGTPEVVPDEGTGLLVDDVDPETLGGAVAEVLRRDWDRSSIVAHARRFSWAWTAESVERALRALGERGE